MSSGDRKVRSELLTQYPLPRVKLEEYLHRMAGDIHEAVQGGVPADLLNVEVGRLKAGLDGGVAQILHGDVIFRHTFKRGEMDRHAPASADALPGVDQAL